jgi:hypothetical protein
MGGSVDPGKSSGTNGESHGACSEDIVGWFYNGKVCIRSSRTPFYPQHPCFRDLGTEGAFDSDIGLRKCLSGRNALIPGPRYYCVTRALISTGSYGESLYESSSGNLV